MPPVPKTQRKQTMGNGRMQVKTRPQRYDEMSLPALVRRRDCLANRMERAEKLLRHLKEGPVRSGLTISRHIAHLEISIPLMRLAIQQLGEAADRKRAALRIYPRVV